MASNAEGWMDDLSLKPTEEQPRSSSKIGFCKSTLAARPKTDSSWCRSIIFFGRRKQKRIISEFVENKSIELQNSECAKHIEELNNLLAIFRDLLIHVAKPQDGPEIRDRIRENRRKCLDLCVAASGAILPQIKSDVAEGIPVDSQQLVNLVCCTQLFHKELKKCQFLVQSHPMDMTAFYEKKPRSSGMSVLDRLVLFKVQPRDYHKEELQSIARDTEEIADLLKDMKEFMPCESGEKSLIEENIARWNKRPRKSVCQFAEDWICYCGSNLG
ncbi:uncharacterized protein LOC129224753 [Uloborus diversus]|uniref:uncharacterized protein LOC129224753 n=1 Tax=Uloborus diversus TaxID=327109 RepID=UPI0024097ACC|nr:uncharacterized protein LOC129224753 [Uloborus diversus]